MKENTAGCLSSEKREDIWAIILALLVLLFSVFAPDLVHDIFKKYLFII